MQDVEHRALLLHCSIVAQRKQKGSHKDCLFFIALQAISQREQFAWLI
jgi:hypothetical protein